MAKKVGGFVVVPALQQPLDGCRAATVAARGHHPARRAGLGQDEGTKRLDQIAA